MTLLRTIVFAVLWYAISSGFCLYADETAPIQSGDHNTTPEKPALTSADVLSGSQEAMVQQATEMAVNNLNQNQSAVSLDSSYQAESTRDLADSINERLNSPSEVRGGLKHEAKEEPAKTTSQKSEETSALPTHSEITNYSPAFFNKSDSDTFNSSRKTPKEIENLLDFIAKSGTSISPIDSDKMPENRSWVEAFDLKLLQIEAERNRMEARLNDQKKDEDVIVLDTINFTEQIRGIHQLLNPPARLHPWLKWLLYSNRTTPQMLELYYSALRERDRIYMLATKANGKLKIRYRGRIMDVPIFVWPEQAQGLYELVMMKRQGVSEMKVGTSNSPPALNRPPS